MLYSVGIHIIFNTLIRFGSPNGLQGAQKVVLVTFSEANQMRPSPVSPGVKDDND